MNMFEGAPWFFRVVFFGIVGAWIWMAAMMIRSSVGRRRLSSSTRVSAADLRSMDGETVEVSGHVVPGPGGVVSSFTGEIPCVYVRRTVAVHMEFDEPEGTGTDWSTKVEHDAARPAAEPWFGIQDETGTVWTCAAHYAKLPAETLVDEEETLKPGWGEESRHRRTTERAVKEGTPVTVRGTVEIDADDRPWLRPTLGERLQRIDQPPTRGITRRIPSPKGFRASVRRTRDLRSSRPD